MISSILHRKGLAIAATLLFSLFCPCCAVICYKLTPVFRRFHDGLHYKTGYLCFLFVLNCMSCFSLQYPTNFYCLFGIIIAVFVVYR